MNNLGIRKKAYINDAVINLIVGSGQITAYLLGSLPNGGMYKFGECMAINLGSRGIQIDSKPGYDIWEIHKYMDEAYRGLGYMNDLYVAVLTQVKNNGGICFSNVGINSYISEEGKKHTIESLGSKILKTPVIVVYSDGHSRIFELNEVENIENYILRSNDQFISDPEYLKKIKETIKYLSEKPYERIEIKHENLPESIYIISAFKIEAVSPVSSIPIKYNYDEPYDINKSKYSYEDKDKDRKIRDLYVEFARGGYNLEAKGYGFLRDFLIYFHEKSWAQPYLDKAAKIAAERDGYYFLRDFIDKPWAEPYIDLAANSAAEKKSYDFLFYFSDKPWAKPYLDKAAKLAAERDGYYFLRYFGDKPWAQPYIDLAAKIDAEENSRGFIRRFEDKYWANKPIESIGGITWLEYAKSMIKESSNNYKDSLIKLSNILMKMNLEKFSFDVKKLL